MSPPDPSAPIPPFASYRGTHSCERRNQRSTSHRMMLTWHRARRQAAAMHNVAATPISVPDEADDVLDGVDGFGRDRLRAVGTVGQHRIDIGRILDQTLHLRADRPELGDRDVDQRRLEGGELSAAEFAQYLGLGL